jgi:hypothetical protein
VVRNGQGNQDVTTTTATTSISSAMTTTVATEQTSLLSQKSTTLQHCVWWKQILWYAGGFPLWSRIAAIGHQGVVTYAQQTLTVSNEKNQQVSFTQKIGPSRIGDVDHSALQKLLVQRQKLRDSSGHNLPLVRSLSDVEPGTSSLLAPRLERVTHAAATVTFVTSQNAQPIADTTTTSTTTTTTTLEPDPQDRLQTWWDFAISIFYICFGIIALLAGLISLSVSD